MDKKRKSKIIGIILILLAIGGCATCIVVDNHHDIKSAICAFQPICLVAGIILVLKNTSQYASRMLGFWFIIGSVFTFFFGCLWGMATDNPNVTQMTAYVLVSFWWGWAVLAFIHGVGLLIFAKRWWIILRKPWVVYILFAGYLSPFAVLCVDNTNMLIFYISTYLIAGLLGLLIIVHYHFKGKVV